LKEGKRGREKERRRGAEEKEREREAMRRHGVPIRG